MAKSNFQDILPPDKRSIKRIPVPERRREPVERVTDEDIFDEPEQPKETRKEKEVSAPRRKKVKKPSRAPQIIITLIVLAAIIGTGIWAVARVSEAKITVTPKQQDIAVDATFAAQKTGGDLQFQTVTIEKVGKLGVAANGQETAQVKATGQIYVYNTTGVAQALVAGTRFETPEGVIFRIPNPITVPPKTGATPGSITTMVTADAAGPEYNVGTKDMTITGFKGSPKYTQFYARTNPQQPIQGGFSGTRPKVVDADVAAAETKIQSELKDNLIQEAQKDIPNGYILPNNAYDIEYESLPLTPSSSGADVNERATFHGFIFSRSLLAFQVLKKVNTAATDTAVDLANADKLAFTLKTPVGDGAWQADAITFSLKGTASIVSTVDTEKLKSDLVGKSRKSLSAILAGYPSVLKAQVTIRPFWRTDFPTNKDELKIIVDKPELSP